MPLMKEAMSKEDFDRQEKGLPPVKKEKAVIPEPKHPVVEYEMTLENDFVEGYTIKLEYARKNALRNEDGILFVGFDVSVECFCPRDKNGEKTNDQLIDYALAGWMTEGEFLAFLRRYRKDIDQQVITW